MYVATKGIVLPTTITGSLPRPAWYTKNLGRRTFNEAMIGAHFREQYVDAVSAFLRDQETAGLDICTDGDCRFDLDVGGYSWFGYPLYRMKGLEIDDAEVPAGGRRAGMTRGRILHEGLEARVMPNVVGPIGRGALQYTALWKTAQRLTERPVKFGTISAERIALSVRDKFYNDRRALMMAIANALNAELHELADEGCPAIQIEEPQIHLMNARSEQTEITHDFLVDLFNTTVRGLRAKTEVWCHSCWGNPAQQRMFAEAQSYGPVVSVYNKLDADVITFENCASGGIDLEAFGRGITDKKVAIGVIDHHTLQVETPEQVAAMVRAALKHIPAEQLVLTTDCGMGREGMSRRHAFYKTVAIVLGTNIVRKELGLPVAKSLAAEERFSLARV
jgi:5-methyltetrahydropteroyltriglutamate--homocysteine methyltransferase